ncbi:MAG: hypothetical protein VKL39_12965 [Leptolyngbyaceae bacterium]|nr:hypothetical protein [Leptolyngbyaceae bacterium]
MNFLKELVEVWRHIPQDSNLRPSDVCLIQSLWMLANQARAPQFKARRDTILDYSKMTKNQYYRSLTRLIRLGYLRYQAGRNHYALPHFHLLSKPQPPAQPEPKRDSKTATPYPKQDTKQDTKRDSKTAAHVPSQAPRRSPQAGAEGVFRDDDFLLYSMRDTKTVLLSPIRDSSGDSKPPLYIKEVNTKDNFLTEREKGEKIFEKRRVEPECPPRKPKKPPYATPSHKKSKVLSRIGDSNTSGNRTEERPPSGQKSPPKAKKPVRPQPVGQEWDSKSPAPHTFAESPWADFEDFEREFLADEHYQAFNAVQVYETVKQWSLSKPDRKMSNWMATARTWVARNPEQYSTLKTQTQNGKQTNKNGHAYTGSAVDLIAALYGAKDKGQ